MKNKNVILFMGIQGSGKTTFYKENFKDTHAHVSLDVLNTRNKERLAIENCIADGKNFVVDNTNPTVEDRKKYIEIAKKNGYKICGYYFKSSIAECIERNEKREGKAKVPRCAIACTLSKFEIPDYEEGFDELYYVWIDKDKSIVEEWRTEDEV